jgi:hypothetical protein
MKSGDVIFIWLEAKHIGGAQAKFKYAIFVGPTEKRFLLINSEPRHVTSDQNVRITNEEATFLPNPVSYVDTSRLIGLTSGEFRNGMARRGARECGQFSRTVVARILSAVAKSKTLPGWQKRLIATQLTPQR